MGVLENKNPNFPRTCPSFPWADCPSAFPDRPGRRTRGRQTPGIHSDIVTVLLSLSLPLFPSLPISLPLSPSLPISLSLSLPQFPCCSGTPCSGRSDRRRSSSDTGRGSDAPLSTCQNPLNKKQ